jgi:DNA adenine methylase
VQAQRGVDLPEADVWGNLEGAFKATCYTTVRSAYNVSRSEGSTGVRHAALFFFLREYAYAAMFRFNASGEFNVPYGGMTYNRKDFAGKIDHLRAPAVIERLESTTLFCEDFEAFLGVHSPTVNDFVFLDPPYDSDFSDYDRNSFGRRDHARLAAQMADLPCRFQLVIKSTPAVLDIYANESWNVLAFDKKYMWTIKERNDRDATHLMITNYAPEPTKAGSWDGPR